MHTLRESKLKEPGGDVTNNTNGATESASPADTPRIARDSGDGPGLYVHVPFCRTKCPYCDFYSSTAGAGIPRWLECLAREIERYRGFFNRFDTVYLGGGTPSLLDEREISRLMSGISVALEISDDPEITIELNPDDVTRSKLAAYSRLGINRLSLGVQSLDDAELRFLGRRHGARQALDAIRDIRDAGFDNIGVDLIYGFEGQSISAWRRTLQRVLDLSPEHISCYQMTIVHGTPFGAMREAGALRVPGEESQRRFFIETAELLGAGGYLHYEVSNFARGERHVSRHNSKYWRHAPYLGLGPAAHSFNGKERWWNVRSVTGYCRALESGTAPRASSERLTPDQLDLERMFLGLRTRDGIDLDPASIDHRAHRTLRALQEESLITIDGTRVTATLEGLLVADRIPLLLPDSLRPGASGRLGRESPARRTASTTNRAV